MVQTLKSKTLTVSVDRHPATLLEWLATPENLPLWHGVFCRSIQRAPSGWIASSRRGPIPIRFLRDDRSGLLDLVLRENAGEDLTLAMRVLPNGSGSEVVFTIIQSPGLSDQAYQEHMRWAEKAIHGLKKLPIDSPSVKAELPRVSVEADETAEASSIPPSDLGDEPPIAEPGPSTGPTTSKRLYIGNLPFDWTDEQLREHFKGAGQIESSEVARYGRNGRSRGFGFVEMASEIEAQAAIDKLHGSMAGTRKIVVRPSRPKESRGPSERPPHRSPRPSSADPATADLSGSPDPVPEALEGPETPEPGNQAPRSARRGDEAAPGPGNERFPIRRRSNPGGRPAPSRGRREVRGRFPGTAPRRDDEAGVINTGGYEFFPRGQKVSSDPTPSEPPRRSPVEASPYMEDSGDIENRGGRRPPPRHRRRPPQRTPRK